MAGVNVREAIRFAELLLPGEAASGDAIDPRWQAILRVGEFIEGEPEEVWAFAAKWGCSSDSDLQDAVATCLVEHLLEHHFDLLISRVEALAASNSEFRATVSRCWSFGEAELPRNAERLQRIVESRGPAA